MKNGDKFLKSLIEVAHIEFQSYDFYRHRVIFSSGLAERILGYSEQEFAEHSRNYYQDLIHPDDLQKMQESIDKIIQSVNGEIVEMTARYRRADGNYIWIYTRKMVVDRGEKDFPCTITTVAEDITDFIELQGQLREKIQVLESISYKNSHLLRSPVASIIGLINLIEEKDITSEHNMQIFNFLKQAIEKLDSVIHEINDLSR
jgi:PAS domain S-box-containing protein